MTYPSWWKLNRRSINVKLNYLRISLLSQLTYSFIVIINVLYYIYIISPSYIWNYIKNCFYLNFNHEKHDLNCFANSCKQVVWKTSFRYTLMFMLLFTLILTFIWFTNSMLIRVFAGKATSDECDELPWKWVSNWLIERIQLHNFCFVHGKV